MNKVQTVEIYNQEVTVKEYKGKRFVTFKDIDTVHRGPIGTANKKEEQQTTPIQSEPEWDRYLRAAEIIAGLPGKEDYVIKCLRYVVPGLDDVSVAPIIDTVPVGSSVIEDQEPEKPKRKNGVPININLLVKGMVKIGITTVDLATMVGVMPKAVGFVLHLARTLIIFLQSNRGGVVHEN